MAARMVEPLMYCGIALLTISLFAAQAIAADSYKLDPWKSAAR
jgi:hypothetical protein